MTNYHATAEGNIPFTAEEEAEWAAEQAAWAAGANDRKASEIRTERNTKLAATDWWVSKAAEVKAAVPADQRTYRQQLRDITEQSGFPYNIVWPEQP